MLIFLFFIFFIFIFFLFLFLFLFFYSLFLIQFYVPFKIISAHMRRVRIFWKLWQPET